MIMYKYRASKDMSQNGKEIWVNAEELYYQVEMKGFMDMCGNHEGIQPKIERDIHLSECMSHVKEMSMFTIYNANDSS